MTKQRDTMMPAPPPDTAGVTWQIEHDGFKGREIGSYTTLEGKQGAVLQQIGTQVVHVYNRKWLKPCPAGVMGEPVTYQCRFQYDSGEWSEWQNVISPWDGSRDPLWEYRALYAHPTPLDRQAVERETIERCAKIAEAIDSGRGNEKEIAKAIRALPPLPGTEGDSSVARSDRQSQGGING